VARPAGLGKARAQWSLYRSRRGSRQAGDADGEGQGNASGTRRARAAPNHHGGGGERQGRCDLLVRPRNRGVGSVEAVSKGGSTLHGGARPCQTRGNEARVGQCRTSNVRAVGMTLTSTLSTLDTEPRN